MLLFLKEHQKGLFVPQPLNGPGTLVPSHRCVVDQQLNGLFASPMERVEGVHIPDVMNGISFVFVPRP